MDTSKTDGPEGAEQTEPKDFSALNDEEVESLFAEGTGEASAENDPAVRGTDTATGTSQEHIDTLLKEAQADQPRDEDTHPPDTEVPASDRETAGPGEQPHAADREAAGTPVAEPRSGLPQDGEAQPPGSESAPQTGAQPAEPDGQHRDDAAQAPESPADEPDGQAAAVQDTLAAEPPAGLEQAAQPAAPGGQAPPDVTDTILAEPEEQPSRAAPAPPPEQAPAEAGMKINAADQNDIDSLLAEINETLPVEEVPQAAPAAGQAGQPPQEQTLVLPPEEAQRQAAAAAAVGQQKRVRRALGLVLQQAAALQDRLAGAILTLLRKAAPRGAVSRFSPGKRAARFLAACTALLVAGVLVFIVLAGITAYRRHGTDLSRLSDARLFDYKYSLQKKRSDDDYAARMNLVEQELRNRSRRHSVRYWQKIRAQYCRAAGIPDSELAKRWAELSDRYHGLLDTMAVLVEEEINYFGSENTPVRAGSILVAEHMIIEGRRRLLRRISDRNWSYLCLDRVFSAPEQDWLYIRCKVLRDRQSLAVLASTQEPAYRQFETNFRKRLKSGGVS